MAKVEVFSAEYCPYCTRAKQLLDKKKVTYEEVRIDIHQDRIDEMVNRSGGIRTVPQIFINGQSIGGCDDLYALERAGQLDELLKG